MADAAYRFGRFELRPAARELLADGQPQRLGGRAFALLECLVARAGRAVSRDELFAHAWPGRVVVDDNLKVQVMALRKLLGADAIVTAPGRGYRFVLPVEPVAPAADPPAAAPVGAAGPALIGREAEIARSLQVLSTGRLLTLLGPGGIGKTRLALALAEIARPLYDDGAAVVELAPLADAAEVPATVWRALRLPSRGGGANAAALAETLRPLRMLIVLDNCEHLRDAVAALAETLLDAAPQLSLLITSQEPLGLGTEQTLRLAGLPVPGDGAPTPARVAASPAVALFAARARMADARFVVDEANAAAVAEICRRLDGMPLALELAAARVPVLGAAGVAQRLGQLLQLLTRGAHDAPARQQTLRGALQWSHSLLDVRQKAVFRRLGVFSGSFALGAALRVAADDPPGDPGVGEPPPAAEPPADDWELIDTLTALVDKSLVQVLPGGGEARRYRLLESARAFALERLAEAGELRATRRRHALAMLDLVDAAEAAYHGAPLLPWITALLPDLDNLRAAVRWAAGDDGDPALAFALVGTAGSFQAAAGLDGEARQWLDRVAPLLGEHTPPLRAARYWQARALRLINPTAPVPEGVDAARRAAATYQGLGDASGAYRMLALLVQHLRRVDAGADLQPLLAEMRALEQPEWNALQRLPRLAVEARLVGRAGDWSGYRERFHTEGALLAEIGDEMRAWGSMYHVALADLALDAPRRAIAVLEPAVARIRTLGLLRQQWTRPALLVMAHVEAGETAVVAGMLRETVMLLRVAGAPGWMADHLAWWAAQIGADEDAARLLGWADDSVSRRGERARHHHIQRACDRTLALIEPRLPAARLAGLRAEGRELLDELALQRVLQLAGPVAG